MRSKIVISENDKRHILKLYGLLNEAETEPGTSPTSSSTQELKIDKKINFGPGHYGLSSGGSYTGRDGKTYGWDVDSELKEGLNKIKEFLKSNPTGYVVGVTLMSGESQIPNDDALKGGADLKLGELSDLRLQSLKNYLNPIFEGWKSEGINTDFTIDEKKENGKTPWVGSVFCPPELTVGDSAGRKKCYNNYVKILKDTKNPLHSKVVELSKKYFDEQYFRVIISVNKTGEPEVASVEETEKGCDLTQLTITVDVKNHLCNNAEFFLLANTTVLYNSEGGYTANGNDANTSLEFKGYIINPQRLNPGFGWLPNGNGTKGNYKYGVKTDLKGDSGGARSDTFTITPEQANTILEASTDRKIHIWYICVLEDGGCHLDMPMVTIKYGEKVIVDGVKPKSNAAYLTSIDQCGQSEVLIKTIPQQPDVSEWRTKYLNDRLGFEIDNELQGEPDGKQKLLKGVNVLNNLWKAHLQMLTGGIEISFYPIDTLDQAKRLELKEKWIKWNPELYASLKKADNTTITFFDNFNKKVIEFGYSAKLTKKGELKFRGREFEKDETGMFQDIKQNLKQLYEEMGKLYTFDLGKSADEYEYDWNLGDGPSLSKEVAIANKLTTPNLKYYDSETGNIVANPTQSQSSANYKY
jgi:hypothetical protein